MEDKLQMIAAKRRDDVQALLLQHGFEAVLAEQAAAAGPALNLLSCIETAHSHQHACIATEFKRASPSKGAINTTVSLEGQIETYTKAGAQIISVLTEPDFFKGSLDDLRKARDIAIACSSEKDRPLILRKDFIVHRLQIYEARASGADTLLLIVAILSVDELKEFISTSRELGMEPLVEAANEAEMHTAVAAGARVVGVNNRDLRSFKVDLGTTARLIAHVRSAKDLEIQQPVFVLSLSGIRGGTDVGTVARGCVPPERHADSSVHLAGILVGEALMKASDPAQLVAEMRGAFRRDSHTAGGAAADAVCRGLVKVCGITNAEDALQAARSGAQLLGMIRVPGSKRCCSPTTARGISEQVKLFREQDPTPALQAGLQTALAQAAGSSAATRAELATGGDLSAACAWFNTFWRVGLQAAAQRAPPLTVGVYQNAPMEHVAADAAACGFDLVQLHGDESVQDVLQLPPTLPVIRVVHLPPADSAQPQGKACGELLQHAVPGAAAVLLVDARRAGQQGGGTGAAVDWAALGHLQASVAELAPGAAHLPFIVAGGVTPDNAARAIHESKASGVDVSSGVEGAPTDAGVPKKHHPAVLQYVTASRAALQGAAETQCADQGTAAGAAASSSAAAASAAPTS